MPIKISIHIDKRSTFSFTHWWLMLSAINMADNNITVRIMVSFFVLSEERESLIV